MPNEILHCEAGHDWSRQSTRGRKPRWCPEHRPVPYGSTASPARPAKAPEARKAAETAALPPGYTPGHYGVMERFYVTRPDGSELATAYTTYNSAMDAANKLNSTRAAMMPKGG